jgi:gliding motility-associated-like protein
MTYSIDGTTYTNATGIFTGLVAGNYSVTAKSLSGCISAATSVTVNAQPATLAAPSATITAQPSCAVATGTITITAPTGAGLTYSIDGTNYTNTTGVFIGLAAGTYPVSARSAAGCISAATTLTVNSQPAILAAPTATTDQPTCTIATGTITITAPIGAGITYSMDGITYTNSTGVFIGLVAGTYNVTAKSASGCISAPITLTINAVNITSCDSDGDGVTDAQEAIDGTDPNNPCSFKLASQVLATSAAWKAGDCDGDGLTNQEEKTGIDDPSTPANPNGKITDPLNVDTDGDGVTDAQEAIDGTDPTNSCSFKLASQTVATSGAWKSADCDGDGLTNQEEKTGIDDPSTPANPNGKITDPLNKDTDGDGVSDAQEAIDGTDPTNPCSFKLASQTVATSTAWKAADCDGDGLTNQEEKTGIDDPSTPANPNGKITDPLNVDTDGDGVTDAQETIDGTDPTNPCSFKLASQTVATSAAWKASDCDGDGLTNQEEKTGIDDPSTPANPKGNITDPFNKDMDGDGVTDAQEAIDGTNPNDPCSFKLASQTVATSAAWKAADCDGDGVTNGQEILDGTDPLNGCSYSASHQTLITSAAWKLADCDGDGMLNGVDPDPKTPLYTPDFNETNINVPVSGNVSSNDKVPAGSSYGTPIPSSTNPAGASMTMNPNGTYTFTGTAPGTYTYQVPVCAAGQTTNCPTGALVITVKDPSSTKNPPIANADVVTLPAGSSTTTNVLANDKSSNPGTSLNPASVAVTTAPAHGTVVVNADGTIKYTPAAGFVGTDVLTYSVCDTSTPVICTTAKVYYTVNPATAPAATAASDDYATTTGTIAATGNVLSNDTNTAGASLSASVVTGPTAAQGALTMNSNGTYNFTPAQGFSGPVDVVYTACTGATPPVCANATLHILVDPAPTLTPDFNETNINVPVSGNVSTNDKVSAGSSYGTPMSLTTNPTGGTLVMNPNGTYTFTGTTPGTYTYYVPVCAPGQTSSCPKVPLVISVLDPNSTTNNPVANSDIATTLAGIATTVNILANDRPSNPGVTLNPSSVVVQNAAKHGTVVVNSDGSIKYTPALGFVGTDSLTYNVCDTSIPALCNVAKVYLTVNSSTSAAVTFANDDYNTTNGTTPATGNVLLNDKNSQGASITVTGNSTVPASKGALVMKADGSYTFTPAPGFTGPIDVVYTVCSTTGICSNATLHILVNANHKPVALPDNFQAKENTMLTGNILGNDFDSDSNTLIVNDTPVSAPKNGQLILKSNGDYTYMPNKDFRGTDSFVYEVCDTNTPALCTTATVTIVLAKDETCEVYVPNSFSPNNDNIHDTFKVKCLYNYENPIIEIFNRWGNLIYKKEHYGDTDFWGSESEAWWDGRSDHSWNVSNDILPVGTYYYILKLQKEKILTGFIYLNR